MSKTIHLYLPTQLEKAVKKVLENSDDFENESTFIRSCIKKRLKEDYYDLLMDIVREYEE